MDTADDSVRLVATTCDDHVERTHASLHYALPRLRDELAALAAPGPPNASLDRVRAAFAELADQIQSHLAKEENLLFPALDALSRGRPPLPFVTIVHPIRLLEAEHGRIEAALDGLRALAQEADVPVSLADGWSGCLARLAELDRELREHHRRENEVLFPAALDLERRVL
jgi:regulator of cell morphogenesis and NO signaling